MLFVFLFFILIIAIISLKIRIKVKNIRLSNIDEKGNKTELKSEYNISFNIYIFWFIRILKIKIDNTKIEMIQRVIKNAEFDINILKKNKKYLITLWKSLKIKELKFQLEIGTEGVTSTVAIIVFLSTAVPITVRNANKIDYQIMPIYNCGNVVNLCLNSIIEFYLTSFVVLEIRDVGAIINRPLKKKGK